MLALLRQFPRLRPATHLRLYSQITAERVPDAQASGPPNPALVVDPAPTAPATTATTAYTSTPTATATATAASASPSPRKLAYFVPRNSNGNLPVYSDIRNNGTRYLILIRNIDGQAHALASDLQETLFKSTTSKAARAKVEVRGKCVMVQGGRWKNEVTQWLVARGF